jgi:hypothetical protein
MASSTYEDFDIDVMWGDRRFIDITITIRDSNGTIVPNASLTGYKIFFTAKERKSDDVPLFAFNTANNPTNIAITDAANRKVRVSLLPTTYSGLAIVNRDYQLYTDIKILAPGGTGDLETVARGIINILQSPTESLS